VGVVTAQAGPGLLHVDGLRARGVAVPPLTGPTRQRLASLLPPLTYQANPVDTGRPGPAFGDVLAAVAADPGIDLVSVYALTEPDALDLPAAVARTNGRPLVAALEAAGHHRFLVEAMAPPGVDLLAGASRDPVFGPVVLLGLGGVVAEALADVAVALAPLTAAQAAGLADQLEGRALLDGFRGGPASDRAALGTVLTRLGELLAAHPDIEEVEINPLRITRDGLVALDAVLRTRKNAQGGAR